MTPNKNMSSDELAEIIVKMSNHYRWKKAVKILTERGEWPDWERIRSQLP